MTLDEELRPRAINAVEIELHEKLEDISDGDGNQEKYRSANLKPSTNTNKHYSDKDTTYSGSQITPSGRYSGGGGGGGGGGGR